MKSSTKKATSVTPPGEEILRGNNPPKSRRAAFHVVLVEPEIPQNTGNIGRTCVGFQSDLHLIEPLGFAITDRQLKRAGLDYWTHLRWKTYGSLDEWKSEAPSSRVFYFSSKATRLFYDQEFRIGDCFVFGKETKGLGPEILQRNSEYCLKVPIEGPIRGYNLATAVAMVLSEAHRQTRLDPK